MRPPEGSTYTATVKVCGKGYLFVSAIGLAVMAKMQRVVARASLIYKTAFLVYQKRGADLRASLQKSLKAGEKKGNFVLTVINDDPVTQNLKRRIKPTAAGKIPDKVHRLNRRDTVERTG